MKLSVLLLFSCFHLHFPVASSYDAIFSFGDSNSDTGNFLLYGGAAVLPGIAHLPHGMTYFGYPTGRCSDGRIIIDFIAEAFGLPFLPASLAQNQSFARGANFAVAGATALAVSFFEERGVGGLLVTNVTFDLQLQWFEQLIPSLCPAIVGECSDFLSKSLFVVGEIGINDYYYPLFAGLSFDEVETFVPLVIEIISDAIERLIGLGAVNLVVPGIPAIGCTARILTVLGGSDEEDFEADTGCLRKANELVKRHNSLLHGEVARLRSKHPGAKISYADFYEPVIQFVRSPNYYGFKSNPLNACCGGGGPYNYNPKVLCGTPGSNVRADPSSAMDWDGGHLTEAAFRQIAQFWLQGPYAEPPILDRSNHNFPMQVTSN